MGNEQICARCRRRRKVIRRDNLLNNITRQREHPTRHYHVGDLRGLFPAELVPDRASKADFEPKHKLRARIKQEAMTQHKSSRRR